MNQGFIARTLRMTAALVLAVASLPVMILMMLFFAFASLVGLFYAMIVGFQVRRRMNEHMKHQSENGQTIEGEYTVESWYRHHPRRQFGDWAETAA